MPTISSRTLRSAHRKPGEPLNILVVATHERYESMLACTGHRFWALQGPGLKTWDTRFAPVPDNYAILNAEEGEHQVPRDVEIDLVLSQSLSHQNGVLKHFARAMGLPVVTLFHVLPDPRWGAGVLEEHRKGGGNLNVFISDYSRDAWGFSGGDTEVVEHGIDTAVFQPAVGTSRIPIALSVVNQWEKRDKECGFNFWRKATEGQPTLVVGDNPGLSEPAGSVAELAMRYRTSQVFVNTSQVSPIPTTLLEAMASGACVLSTRNPMIESVVTDGLNGYLADDPEEMKGKLNFLLSRPEVCELVGLEAVKTIRKRFGLNRFLCDWEKVFRRADEMVVREVL